MIALNQANRGDLLRSPTRAKLAKFIATLNDNNRDGDGDGDPTSLWYFLSIHDTILFPLVEFLQWQRRVETQKQQQQQRHRPQQQTTDNKRSSCTGQDQEQEQGNTTTTKTSGDTKVDITKRPRLV